MKNEMDKTITFSIREEERDRERKMLLRTVYDALSEKGYNPRRRILSENEAGKNGPYVKA